MLRRKPGINLHYFGFDVLAVDGHPTTMNSYAERRALLGTVAKYGPRQIKIGLTCAGPCAIGGGTFNLNFDA